MRVITRRLRGLTVVATVVAFLATACGSTVQYREQRVAGAADGGLTATAQGSTAQGGDTAATANGTGGVAGSPGARRSGATAGAAGSAGAVGNATTGGASGGAGSTASPGQVPVKGPGITATKMYIGIWSSTQAGAADKTIGAAGAAPSYDPRDVYNAVIAYANSHGGFAGRQLEMLYYDYNTTTDTSTQDQSACAFWTQDHKVFAMLGGTDIRDDCAEKAGGVALGAGSGTASTYQKFPHLADPNTMRLDRLGVVTANGLFKAGYFTGKLGLVTWDAPDYRYTIDHGYVPTLASHGVTPADTAYIAVPQQVGAISDTSSAVSAAVNKFRAEGIDHVIVQDGPAGVFGDAGLTLEWMNQAKSQQYKPRYGQNAHNAPGWSVLPADQMDGAVAVDSTDTDPKYDEGWHSNAARDRCFKIQADAGYPPQSNNVNDEDVAAAACDTVFFLQQIVNSLPVLSADAFVQAVQRLGTSFQPSFVYGSKFADQRDGGGMVRTEDYSAACQCLSYRGEPYYGD